MHGWQIIKILFQIEHRHQNPYAYLCACYEKGIEAGGSRRTHPTYVWRRAAAVKVGRRKKFALVSKSTVCRTMMTASAAACSWSSLRIVFSWLPRAQSIVISTAFILRLALKRSKRLSLRWSSLSRKRFKKRSNTRMGPSCFVDGQSEPSNSLRYSFRKCRKYQ